MQVNEVKVGLPVTITNGVLRGFRGYISHYVQDYNQNSKEYIINPDAVEVEIQRKDSASGEYYSHDVTVNIDYLELDN